MSKGERSLLRGNAFLLAAAVLPVAVVGLFLLSTAIPQWTVPPPQYDLLLRASDPYDGTRPRVAVDFAVRNGQVEATVRTVTENHYPQGSSLFLFDHETSQLRSIRFDIPNVTATTSPMTVPVEAVSGWTILDQPVAPDGYAFESRIQRGPGIVGELFGMNRYDTQVSLVKDGRVIPIPAPSSSRYHSPMSALGWVTHHGQP
jgi:hypothetical protein